MNPLKKVRHYNSKNRNTYKFKTDLGGSVLGIGSSGIEAGRLKAVFIPVSTGPLKAATSGQTIQFAHSKELYDRIDEKNKII